MSDDTDTAEEIEPGIPQAPLDTDPDDQLEAPDAPPEWPYDPDTESRPDMDEEATE